MFHLAFPPALLVVKLLPLAVGVDPGNLAIRAIIVAILGATHCHANGATF